MVEAYTYQPVLFFGLILLITFFAGFTAAWWSYKKNGLAHQLLWMLIGLFTPFVTSMVMIYGSGNVPLINDFWQKLSLGAITPYFWPTLLLMPIVVTLATLISLFFGQSAEQFKFSPSFNGGGRAFISSLMLLLAPMVEELGWRGYGIDSLHSIFSVFETTLIFAVLVALWHMPLFCIKGFYQNDLLKENWIYALNFVVSILPATILINWVYYANNKSILVAILLHYSFNIFSVLFRTTQFTKCIITLLLLILSCIVIISDQSLFFSCC